MTRPQFIFILTLVCILIFSIYSFLEQQKNAYRPPVLTIIKDSGKNKKTTPTPLANGVATTPPSPTPSLAPTVKPTPKPTSIPVISPLSAYSVYFHGNGSTTVLYDYKSTASLPIASITKLVTAIAVKKFYPVDTLITVSQDAVEESQTAGKLKEGEVFTRDELLYPMLIESSNDAAYAFAETAGVAAFVSLMNAEAEDIGMTHTHFTNVSGLDDFGGNYSTTRDLAKLGQYLVANHPDLLTITTLKEYHLITAEGTYDINLKTTDASLSDKRIPVQIIGGKTGETDKAKQTLILITKTPNGDGFMVTVILGSTDRYNDMARIINKALAAYKW